jgi:hypothetical protein
MVAFINVRQGECEYHEHKNDELVVQAERADRQKSDTCLQGNVILQYERTRKYSILNTNNIALQIIASEHNFDFHRRPREIF